MLNFLWAPGGLIRFRNKLESVPIEKVIVSGCILGNLNEAKSLNASKRRLIGAYQTLVLSIEEHLKGTGTKNWRKNLRRSQKRDLFFREAVEDDLPELVKIYDNLHAFKGIKNQISYKSEIDLVTKYEYLYVQIKTTNLH